MSVWRISIGELPPLPARPVVLRGTAFAITGWVEYEPTGVLAYRELFLSFAVRDGRHVSTTITHMWVDSPESRAGGRGLWAIPKELAEFTFGPDRTFEAHDENGPLAAASFRRGRGLPLRVPTAFSVLQPDGEELRRSPVRATAYAHLAGADWRLGGSGPFAFLGEHRPWLSLAVRDFRMRFGQAPPGGVREWRP